MGRRRASRSLLSLVTRFGHARGPALSIHECSVIPPRQLIDYHGKSLRKNSSVGPPTPTPISLAKFAGYVGIGTFESLSNKLYSYLCLCLCLCLCLNLYQQLHLYQQQQQQQESNFQMIKRATSCNKCAPSLTIHQMHFEMNEFVFVFLTVFVFLSVFTSFHLFTDSLNPFPMDE